MTHLYPVHLDLHGRPCLVVGGGAIAERRIAGLLEAGAKVTVVSPERTERIAAWAHAGDLTLVARAYRDSDGEGMRLIVAATGDPALNERICEAGEARGQLVNAAAPAGAGNCRLPAVHRGERLLVSVATSGASPAFSRRIAREIGSLYGEETEAVIGFLHRLRLKAKTLIQDRSMREKLLTLLAEADWRPLLADDRLERFGEALLASLAAEGPQRGENAEDVLRRIWPEELPRIRIEGSNEQ